MYTNVCWQEVEEWLLSFFIRKIQYKQTLRLCYVISFEIICWVTCINMDMDKYWGIKTLFFIVFDLFSFCKRWIV